jgi:hypothetical protein
MKKNLLFTALAFAAFSAINAQEIAVRESSEKFSTGSQNAAVTTIYEMSMDDVISEWKKVLKDFKNEKVKDKNEEVFGDNILIKEWGNNPVDFYTKFEEDKKNKTIKMMTAVDLGGTYMTSNAASDKYRFVEKMVKDFAIRMSKKPIEDKLKEAEKVGEKLADNQKDLEKESKNLKSDIEDYKNKIKKAEDDIKKNDDNQVKKKAEIEVQKKAIEEIKKKLESIK